MSDGDRSDADFEILIDGTAMSDDDKKRVRALRVDMVADGPDLFDFTVNSEGLAQTEEELPFPNSSYKVAAEVEVKLGYGDTLVSLFKGEVGNIEVILHELDPPRFVIGGFDRLHRLTRSKVTRHWENVKYSDVASEIASEAGLSGETDSTSITFDYVSMNGRSYLSFLQEIARRVGFEVNCDDKKLLFKKGRSDQGSVATLKFGDNLKRAKIKMQTAGQVTKVRVAAWDDVKKEQVIGEATDSDVSPKLGASKVGPKVASTGFGDAEHWISGYAARSQAEVDEVAKSVMNSKASNFVRLEAELEGDTAIVAGSVVTMEGCSDHFNGDYYVVRATHVYDVGSGPGKGFRTKIVGQRPGWSV